LRRFDRVQKLPRSAADVVDGGVEGLAIAPRRRAIAADLAYVLKGGGGDLLVGGAGVGAT
jgi:hypothetical protein